MLVSAAPMRASSNQPMGVLVTMQQPMGVPVTTMMMEKCPVNAVITQENAVKMLDLILKIYQENI